jgi:putative ABC transport system permease protein
MTRWQADETLGHSWSNDGHPAFLRPLREQMVGDVTRPLWVMLAAVAVVLLIACANVANLLLVRGEARSREISVRAAMGAGRGRIVSQLLTESVVMALVGGLAGLGLAWLGVGTLRRLAPPDLPRLDEIGVHPTVLLFSLGITILAGILFGLVPALQAGRLDVQASLREEGRSGMAGSGRVRLRQLLVVSQTAMAVVLLVAAGLLLRSFQQLQAVDPGFRTDEVVALSINIPATSYPDGPEITAFYRDLLPRIRSLPGVTSAGAVRTAPLGGSLPPNDVEIEGYVNETDGPPLNADIQTVTPGYFETLGIALLQGRDFTAADGPDAPLVAVVSEELAERYWPGESPLGKRIRQSGFPEWPEVVGVVSDVHHEGLDRPVRGTLYFVHAQGPRTWFPVAAMTLTVRAAVDPAAIISAVRREVQAMDPDVPLYQVQTMEQVIADSTATQRFTMLLQLLFATVALVLAAVGIYGVMAFTVARRAPEIGIRMALGAERRDVVRMVVGHAMAIVGLALLVGVVGALAAGRVLSSLLFGVSPRDPATYALVVGSLLAVALLACWIPARRASGVDPGSALRHD